MPALLEAKFAKLPVDLIQVHGKDLTVASTDPSRSGTPAPQSSAASASTLSAAPEPAVKKAQKATNTTTVSTEAIFMAAADDLFSLFTDEKRIPIWSRAAAKVSCRSPRNNTLNSLFSPPRNQRQNTPSSVEASKANIFPSHPGKRLYRLGCWITHLGLQVRYTHLFFLSLCLIDTKATVER